MWSPVDHNFMMSVVKIPSTHSNTCSGSLLSFSDMHVLVTASCRCISSLVICQLRFRAHF